MVLVGEVTDPESEGTKSGEENARSRLMFHRLETPSGESNQTRTNGQRNMLEIWTIKIMVVAMLYGVISGESSCLI